MVLEAFVDPIKKRKAYLFMLSGAIYAIIALFLSNWVFREHASLLMVFLTTMAALPVFVATIADEEKKTASSTKESHLLVQHGNTLFYLLMLFVGFMVGYLFIYLTFPAQFVDNSFSAQSSTIQAINSKVTGDFLGMRTFLFILLNNVKVLVFCMLFAFLYGAGAVFILTWNSSVIATAMGNFVRFQIAEYTAKIGLVGTAAYFKIVSLAVLRYMIHGIPEIFAYFIGGLAGSLISVAIIREGLFTRRFEKVLFDISDLIFISLLFLFFAALLEVYVTPIFF